MTNDLNETMANKGNNSGETARKMLYRHPHDRKLAGVCAGVADLLGLDPLLVRILWAVVTLMTSGAGFLAYLLLWLFLPVGTQAGGAEYPSAIQFRGISAQRLAVVFMALGGLWLLSNLGILPALSGALVVLARVFFWPALFITVGYLIWRGVRGQSTDHSRANAAGWETQARDFAGSLRDLQQGLPLRRSRNNRMILGVCGGLGERLGIDPTLVRLGWVLLSLGTMGAGILVYLIAGVLLPEAGALAGTSDSAAAESMQDVTIINHDTTNF